ncbi:hypothetical protein MVEN_00040600 [Mycena venus]|uniref:Ndc10 domain-containing protein n=1 Tax=Mycena venus TaxID=2733690 RepID=A0A8H6Z3C3_9AGAR|nr:hypothetical protein MVEN_00040600 [Mycena venus]
MNALPGVIDPALLEEARRDSQMPLTTNGVTASSTTSRSPAPPSRPRTRRDFSKNEIASWEASNYAPRRDANESRDDYEDRLTFVTRRAPLGEACNKLSIKVPKKASLERLRQELAKYWFSPLSSSGVAQFRQDVPPAPPLRQHSSDVLNFYPPPEPLHLPPVPGILPTVSSTARGELRGSVPLFHITVPNDAPSSTRPLEGTAGSSGSARGKKVPSRAQTNEGPPEQLRPRTSKSNGSIIGHAQDLATTSSQTHHTPCPDPSHPSTSPHTLSTRSATPQAVRRAEGNRRAGGIKTQNSVVKDFEAWRAIALKEGKIKDGIIDEHALLLYINYSAEREKRTRRGVPIPGSRLGASQIKKLFFGVLRIRKPQDAADPTLAQRRPATTFVVWESLKCRMDEALERVRNGLDESAEDAPDIRANTFLAEVTDAQLQEIGYGFLGHRQLRLVVFGHLAWSAQHASGNRGDDFRALKLAELQPYTMTHPDGRTSVYTVLGLQGEEKAGRRGMRTVVNPSYSAFVANKNPEMCPLGAFAFYHHYIHDVVDISAKLKIDWSVNKSWRQIRVLHGPKSPNTPYNEQNLYNLYCKAYIKAGFSARLKAHLPRHLLGYKQEQMNVDKADTSKLGWVRGATYFDTYAPALPKKAILGAAGFKTEETYDPLWMRVHVPPQFLEFICPKAESIRDEIANRANLSGAFNYWQMVVDLRPYAFQCGAAIFQKCPDSALFRLPAFMNTDAKEGNPADLLLVQNAVLRKALEDLYRIANVGDAKLTKLTELLERRTAVFSPVQGFSAASYHRNALAFSSPPSTPPRSASSAPSTSPILLHFDEQMEETGTYQSLEVDGTTSIRAFVNASPKSPDTRRAPTQVDLVLPPTEAFYKKDGPRGLLPPLFGQKSARWPDVFALIQQPKFCWAVWGPRSVDRYRTVDEIWASWIDGEAVYDGAGVQTGKKPPLQERGTIAQHWGRYREIPEWIEREFSRRGVSPSVVIAELEAMRVVGNQTKGMNWLRLEVATFRKQAAKAAQPVDDTSTSSIASTTSTPPLPAPGEAEAELAHLNELGPRSNKNATVYAMDSIENTDGVSLDRAGLLLCCLLLGGDYDTGISGIGPAVAHALALEGFGADLVDIVESFAGSELTQRLAIWRNSVRQELRSNSHGRLGRRQPSLAEKILDTFPNLEVVDLYLNPLTSASPGQIGPMPNVNSWMPREPDIFRLSNLCTALFGWSGNGLLKKLNSNLWPGVAFRMFSSRFVLYDAPTKFIASPATNAIVLKVSKASEKRRAFMDSAQLNLRRVRVSTKNFVALAGLDNLTPTADTDIKLVSIPQVILAVAMRDATLPDTDLTHIPLHLDDSEGSEGPIERESDDEGQHDGDVLEIMDSDEEDLVKAHSQLSAGGVIDLTMS